MYHVTCCLAIRLSAILQIENCLHEQDNHQFKSGFSNVITRIPVLILELKSSHESDKKLKRIDK